MSLCSPNHVPTSLPSSNMSAEDGLMFNEDFAECLCRQANVYNLTRPRTSYCNTPNYPSTSAAPGLRSWGGWALIALLGLAGGVLADV